MVIVPVEVLGKNILDLELFSTLVCNLSQVGLFTLPFLLISPYFFFSYLKFYMDIVCMNDYSSFDSIFDDMKE